MAIKNLRDVHLTAGLQDKDGQLGTSGQILSSTGSQVDWIDQGDIVAGETDKAKSVTIRVKNSTATAMSKGQVVCEAVSASPPGGNLIEVALADNNGTNTMPALGILNEDLDAAGGANDEGDAIMFGKVSGIDTSAFSVGDEVFVDDTPGGLTTTKPTGAKYIQKVGVVIRDDASNGTIEVFGAGRVNDVPTPLYVDHANQRLGIGATAPQKPLDVNGEVLLRDHLFIGGYGENDSTNSIEIGRNRTGDGICFFDMTTDNTTYTDYGFRLIRWSGVNADTELIHRGTGLFKFAAQEAANMTFSTSNSERMRIASNGNVGVGTTSPGVKLHLSTGNSSLPSLDGGTLFVVDATQGSTGNYSAMSILSGTTGVSSLYLGDSDAENRGSLRYNNSSNSLSLGTNGSERMRIASNGNVGIGTTSPSHKLHVAGKSYLSGGIQMNSGDEIDFGNSNQYITGVNDTSLTLATGGSATLTATHAGNVGIGTTSPGEKLHISGGNLEIENNFPSLIINSDNASGVYNQILSQQEGSSSPPQGELWWKDGNQGGGSRWTTRITSAPYTSSYINLPHNSSGGNFAINIENNERLTIDRSNGNVGIGTTSPTAPLTFGKSVYGDFDSENFYRIKLQDQGGTHNDVGIGQTAFGNMGFNITSGGAFIFNNGTSGEIARFNGTGLGIGTTSPGYNLDVTGTARITNNMWLGSNIYHDNDGNSAYIGFPADDTWRVVTGGSERLRVSPSGNVGIGVTGPSYALDVNGTVDATSFRAGGISKYTTYNSTNTYENYGTTISNIASSPVGYLYHDLLAFNYNYTVTQESLTYQGSWQSETLDKRLFSQKQDQAITVVSSSEYAVRWTVEGTAWNNAKFINLAFTYTNPHPETRVIIESSADGTTWTSRHDSTASGITGTKSCYVSSWSGNNYVRITVSKTSNNTNLIKLSSIKMMTARAGDQGDGVELQYPYVWDEDRNIGLLLTKSDTPTSKLDILGATNTSNSSLLRLRSTSVSPNAQEKVAAFYYNTNTERGYIGVNQYGVTYSTSSDYRLKENVVPLSDATDRLKLLKPCRFNFIGGNPNYAVDGFLAHEAAEVVPESVNGEKDAVNENNEPIYQGIDQGKIVPLLTAALQEAIEKIEQLESRIQTLENN